MHDLPILADEAEPVGVPAGSPHSLRKNQYEGSARGLPVNRTRPVGPPWVDHSGAGISQDGNEPPGVSRRIAAGSRSVLNKRPHTARPGDGPQIVQRGGPSLSAHRHCSAMASSALPVRMALLSTGFPAQKRRPPPRCPPRSSLERRPLSDPPRPRSGRRPPPPPSGRRSTGGRASFTSSI